MDRMNQLNEKIRTIRIQLTLEESRPEPDNEKIQQLKLIEQECLERLR